MYYRGIISHIMYCFGNYYTNNFNRYIYTMSYWYT